MSRKQGRTFSAEQKTAIVKRHLVEGVLAAGWYTGLQKEYHFVRPICIEYYSGLKLAEIMPSIADP